jgi:hypothetical protein
VGLFKRKKEVPIRQPHITGQNESYAFRRSHTLTGSSADTVKTVGESRAQIKSPRIRAHELRQHRRRLVLYLIGVIAVLSAGWLLIGEFTGTIANVVSKPATPRVDTKYYSQLLNEYFAAYPLERFRFAVQPAHLNGFLETKAPEIASAEFSSSNEVGKSDLTATFRQPLVAWEIGRQKYYVDAEGHAFQKNYYDEPSIVVTDQSGIDPNSGAIASNRFLHFLGRVVALLNQSGAVSVSGVVIPPNTTREVDLKLAGKPYIVKTQLDRDPAEQVSDIVNVVKYLDAKNLKPKYVDVRVGGRAFYQ